MRKLFRKILVYLTWVLAILLSIANLTVYISPETFWPTAFLGLLFPFLLIFTIALFLYYTTRLRKLLILPLIALFISWNNIENSFQLSGKQQNIAENQTSATQELKILTYNVQVFRLLGNNSFGKHQQEMFAKIKAEDPDIICFQEFYTNTEKGLTLHNIDRLLSDYPHKHIYLINNSTNSNYGIVTYSKYPIVKKESIGFQNTSNASIYSDIIFQEDTLRIFNNHLQSIKFDRDNYEFITNQEKYNQQEKLKALKDISSRLKRAFIKRSDQANLLAEKISQSPYSVIVCGDFNDTPVSYSYHKIRGELEDTFVNAGVGFGNTYVGKFPSYRIDFIFHSKEMATKSFNIPRMKYSDHYPVTTELIIK